MKNAVKSLLSVFKSRTIKLDSRVNIFLFCLFISIFFWFLSALSKEYSTTFTVPLGYKDLPSRYMMTKVPADRVNIQVSGSGFDLLGEQMNLNRKPIILDLSKFISEGKSRHHVPSRYLSQNIKSKIGKDLRLESILIDSVSFTTFERMEKVVNVEPRITPSFKAGYAQRADLILNPSQVKILGSKESLLKVNTIFTEEISISDLSDTMSFTVDLQAPNIDGLVMEPLTVELTIPVEKYTEKEFVLPITMVNQLDSTRRLRVFPDKVKAILLVPLSRYEDLAEELLKAEAVYAHSEVEKKKLEVAIKGVPEYAELIRIEPGRVEFIVLN